MTRGDLQKFLNKANVVAGATLAGLIAINHSPTLSDWVYGHNKTEAAAKPTLTDKDGKPIQICFTDDFKQACAYTWEEAEKKFYTNPEAITPASRMFNESAQRNGKTARTPAIEYSVPKNQIRYAGLHYDVPEQYQRVLKKVTHGDPIGYDVMVKVLGSESGFKNQSSHTGAFSVGQFTLSTFLETAYVNRDKLSAKQRAVIEKNIERYNAAKKPKGATEDPLPVWKYRVAKHGDENVLRTMSKNPEVVAVLAREHMRIATKTGQDMLHDALQTRIRFMKSDDYDGKRDRTYYQRIQNLEYHLSRPMTSADVKIFYLCGSRGGSQLLAAVADPKAHDKKSADYTTKGVVSSNPDVFYKPDGNARSVMDLHSYIQYRVGNIPLPRNLDRALAPPRAPARTIGI